MVKRDISKHAKPEQPTVSMSEEEMVRHLSQTGRYRILTKLVPRAIAPFPRPNTPSRASFSTPRPRASNARKDGIIEIGVNRFHLRCDRKHR